MGTRGVFCIKFRKFFWAIWNQMDSYPEYLGKELVHGLAFLLTQYTDEQLGKMFCNLQENLVEVEDGEWFEPDKRLTTYTQMLDEIQTMHGQIVKMGRAMLRNFRSYDQKPEGFKEIVFLKDYLLTKTSPKIVDQILAKTITGDDIIVSNDQEHEITRQIRDVHYHLTYLRKTYLRAVIEKYKNYNILLECGILPFESVFETMADLENSDQRGHIEWVYVLDLDTGTFNMEYDNEWWQFPLRGPPGRGLPNFSVCFGENLDTFSYATKVKSLI